MGKCYLIPQEFQEGVLQVEVGVVQRWVKESPYRQHDNQERPTLMSLVVMVVVVVVKVFELEVHLVVGLVMSRVVKEVQVHQPAVILWLVFWLLSAIFRWAREGRKEGQEAVVPVVDVQ